MVTESGTRSILRPSCARNLRGSRIVGQAFPPANSLRPGSWQANRLPYLRYSECTVGPSVPFHQERLQRFSAEFHSFGSKLFR